MKENNMKDDNLNKDELIYEIRDKQVMLDSDLAKIYECDNGIEDIRNAVNENISKFPEGFMFQLTDKEYDNLKCNIDTPTVKYNNPYVFTEQGVAMLSSVLKSEIASKINIQIINTFIVMRKYVSFDLIEKYFIN